MIPESEWRPCQAPGCSNLIKPNRKEGRPGYALRKYCNRKCRGIVGFKDIPLKKCGNPECQNMVPRDLGMKPVDYARRKACSPECTRRVMSISAMMRPSSGLSIARSRQNGKAKLYREAAEQRATITSMNEADAIAAFIAQRGITYCPPKYAAPTLNAALSERDAKRVLRRLQIADHRYASWSWRPQT